MAELGLWTEPELVSATGGKLSQPITKQLNGVSIDTRSLGEGDIFVAIKGDQHDGHDFVKAALEKGAGVAIVARADAAMAAAGPVLVVDDPLRALERLGIAARARSAARIVAVTGSVGKTSSKEMLKIALSASGATHASAASFNNHWGVPLTLARMPRDTAYGVFEIGMNHIGEIKTLVAMVRPHVALITNVAPVHVGNFTSVEEIADAKAEIFLSLEPAGVAVLNRDNPYFDYLAAAARKAHVGQVVGFGQSELAEIRAERLVLHETCSCITAEVMGEKLIYKLGIPGAHMALNSLGVMAAVHVLGADLARAGLALAVAEPPKGRGVQQRLSLPQGEFLLIDESYNANPLSMAAALALLGQVKLKAGGRRIAVLGDMLELGQHSAKLHSDIAPLLDQHQVAKLYAAGPEMKHLWDKVATSQQGAYGATAAALNDKLMAELRPGDVVMIKGSNGSRMGLVAEALRSRFAPLMKDN